MSELKTFNIGLEDESWRTQNFRQSVLTKIDESIIEMENHVFQKAKSKEEYLIMVARLIRQVQDIRFLEFSKKGAMAGGPGTPQGLAGLPGGAGVSQENPGGAPNPNQGRNGKMKTMQKNPGGN